jgi:hypothetical protein
MMGMPFFSSMAAMVDLPMAIEPVSPMINMRETFLS